MFARNTFREISNIKFFERAFDSRLYSSICVIVGYSYRTLELEMEYLFGRESQYFDFVGIKSEKRNLYISIPETFSNEYEFFMQSLYVCLVPI